MKDANYWIKELGLAKHPEGGYFRETYRSDELVPVHGLPGRYGGERAFSTSIYYLLKGVDISLFHRLKSDEIWHFHTGSPALIHILDPEGGYERKILGITPRWEGEMQVVIQRGCWFAAEVAEKNSFILAGCTVAPGFDFKDFETGSRELASRYPDFRDLIIAFT